VAGQRQTKFGYFVCEEGSKAVGEREIPAVEEGKGVKDLRCKSLFTVCQRRLRLSADNETRSRSFLNVRMRLWYWLRKNLKEGQLRTDWE